MDMEIPSGEYHNTIDLMLIENRWKTSIRNCRTYQGADIASDHSLVMAKLQLRLKRNKRCTRTVKPDIAALEKAEVRQAFEELIREKNSGRPTERGVNERAEKLMTDITDAMSVPLPAERRKRRAYISRETLELADKKRLLKMHRDESREVKEEYRRLCNEIRTKARTDKEEWLSEKCREIQMAAEQNKSRKTYQLIKEVNGKWKSKQRAIRNKQGKLVQEEEEIRERWTEYCSELYNTTEDEKSSKEMMEIKKKLEEISPASEDRRQPTLQDEVHRAIQKLKNNKSPGSDAVPGEAIKAGGEYLEQELYQIIKMAWEIEEIPKEWTKSIIATIAKKGDQKECENYRTISMLNHTAKVMLNIVLERLQASVSPFLAEEQAGFRRDRGTVQQILILRLLAEKAWRKNKPVYNCFIDFRKAFDTIKHELMWTIMGTFGVDAKIIRVLQCTYDCSMAAVRVGTDLGTWFEQKVGTRQGDPLSPVIFITYLERVMDQEQGDKKGVCISGEGINNLRFADDIDLLEEDIEEVQNNMDRLVKAAEPMGLRVNIGKTKTMVFGRETVEREIKVNGIAVECVQEFVYLGSLLTWDNDCSREIRRRIAQATGAMAGFNNVWNSKKIKLTVKLQVVRSCIFSILLYASETWVIRKNDTDRLMAFEMKCYRRLLNIRWQLKVTNKEIRRRVQATKDIVQVLIERKMNLFGHICRMDNNRMVKKVMLGTMAGANRRGRPRREWLDDIVEWAGADLASLTRAAQDRTGWRDVVRRAVDTNGHRAHGAE